jgi:hypothetical protein
MAFAVEPADESFFDSAPFRYVYPMELAASPEKVWAGLTADRALYWVRGLRVTWTSARPFAVGTTRTAAGMFGVVRLYERYFRWEDGRRQSFTVLRANSPLFRRFAEDYLVEPTDGGCRFTWTFAVEPRGPKPIAAAVGAVQRLIFAAMARDTRRHFGTA